MFLCCLLNLPSKIEAFLGVPFLAEDSALRLLMFRSAFEFMDCA